jgi:methanogenic corrinoid protein MtbC1
MNPYYDEFDRLLQSEKKNEAVNFALDLVSSGKTDVVTLYQDILTPTLNNMSCSLAEKQLCIWKEHVRTAIVRTIVECCYPYVIREKERLAVLPKGKAVVICPPEEYHDLGARMAADFFTLNGYDTVFVGSNTPYQDFYNAADLIRPDIIAISVSNYYNIVATKKIISELRRRTGGKSRIIVGGNAFLGGVHSAEVVGADCIIQTFSDIRSLSEGGEIV